MPIFVSPLEASAERGQDAMRNLQIHRREMQTWLHNHPAAKAERQALQALVSGARVSSAGRVTRYCVKCGWVGYSPLRWCPVCSGQTK